MGRKLHRFPQVDAACSTCRLPVSSPEIILWCSEDAKLSGYRQCEGQRDTGALLGKMCGEEEKLCTLHGVSN